MDGKCWHSLPGVSFHWARRPAKSRTKILWPGRRGGRTRPLYLLPDLNSIIMVDCRMGYKSYFSISDVQCCTVPVQTYSCLCFRGTNLYRCGTNRFRLVFPRYKFVPSRYTFCSHLCFRGTNLYCAGTNPVPACVSEVQICELTVQTEFMLAYPDSTNQPSVNGNDAVSLASLGSAHSAVVRGGCASARNLNFKTKEKLLPV